MKFGGGMASKEKRHEPCDCCFWCQQRYARLRDGVLLHSECLAPYKGWLDALKDYPASVLASAEPLKSEEE